MIEELTRQSYGRVTADAANIQENETDRNDCCEEESNAAEKLDKQNSDKNDSNKNNNNTCCEKRQREFSNTDQDELLHCKRGKCSTEQSKIENEVKINKFWPLMRDTAKNEMHYYEQSEMELEKEVVEAEPGMMLLYIPTSFVNAAGQMVCIRRRCLVNPESDYGRFMLSSSELLNKSERKSVAMMNAEQIRKRVEKEEEEEEIRNMQAEEIEANTESNEAANSISTVIDVEGLIDENYNDDNDSNKNVQKEEEENFLLELKSVNTDICREHSYNSTNEQKQHQLEERCKNSTWTYMRYLPCWRKKQLCVDNDLNRNNYINGYTKAHDKPEMNTRSTSCPERIVTRKGYVNNKSYDNWYNEEDDRDHDKDDANENEK